METAKVPSKIGEMDTIDIFLFSNGQQYSPPRKYHLRHEELNWWDATLGFLARSQYGSMHSSINLYTIEGQKIDGPTGLTNGTAYVAVKPPDAFIPAGYDKYLIKASKSWEKRQVRKSSVDISNPDETNVKSVTSKTEINIESRNIKSSNQDVAEERIDTRTTNEETTATLKSKAIANNHRRLSDSNTLSSIKQIEKRRTPVNQRYTNMRKNSTNATSYPPTIRKPSDKRRDSPKKNLTIASEKINYKENRPKNEDKANNDKTITVIKNNKQPLTLGSVTKLEETMKGMNISSSTKITSSNHKSLITDDSQMENLLADREIVMISNSYKNPDSEIASILVDTEEHSSTFQETVNREQRKSSTLYIPLLNDVRRIPELINEELNSNVDIFDENTHTSNHSKIKVVQGTSQHLINDLVVTEKPISNHKHIAVISRGDVVNLKLNIKVRNGEGIVSTKHTNTHSFRDNLKLEKGSQVNIELKLSHTSSSKPNHEIFTQCRSLESILANEYGHIQFNSNDDRNTKVIIIQCNCCDHHNNMEDLIRTSVASMRENKNYYLLLPSENQNFEKCACNRKMSQKTEKEIEKIEVTTNKSVTSLSKSNPAEFVITRRDIIVPISSIESTLSHKEQTYQRNEYVVTKLNTCSSEDDHQKPEYLVVRKESPEMIEEEQKTEFVVIRKNPLRLSPKIVTDKFSQTEWCSILLEARRHEDGRYSFHLPPLHVLKYYEI